MKKDTFKNYLIIFLIVVTILMALVSYNYLPLDYYSVLLCLCVIDNAIVILLIKAKGQMKNTIGGLISIVSISLLILAILKMIE